MDTEATCPSFDSFRADNATQTAACILALGHQGSCSSADGRSWVRFEEGLRQRGQVYVSLAEGGPGVRAVATDG